MANGTFVIWEIPPGGKPGDGEVFRWTAADKPADANGGGRAAPIGPWETGASLRSVRTVYPGALIPSKQVLGSNEKPFTWHGVFDDRFNFPGYAVKEEKRILAHLRRGNAIKVEYRHKTYVGFVDEVSTTYILPYKIGYSITVDVHAPSDAVEWGRSPTPPANPGNEVDELGIIAADMADTQAQQPALSMSSDATDVGDGLASISTHLDGLTQLLDTSTGVLSPIGAFLNLVMRLRSLQGQCSAVLAQLASVRSDIDVGVRTAKNVLDFECWSRDLKKQLWMAVGKSQSAADGIEKRDIPATTRLYRPRKGESLYNVSQVCYGTPYRNRDIQIANNLSSSTLDGTEVLIIPEGKVAA